MKTNPETTLWDKIFSKYWLENDITTARISRVIDFTLTFYLEIYEIPRPFWDQDFRDQYRDFETKILETDTETFFKTKIFETDIKSFHETKYLRDRYSDSFRDQNFQDWNCYFPKNEKSLDAKKSGDEVSHSDV